MKEQYKGIKTRREHIESLPEPFRSDALEWCKNCTSEEAMQKYGDIYFAVAGGVAFYRTRLGDEKWREFSKSEFGIELIEFIRLGLEFTMNEMDNQDYTCQECRGHGCKTCDNSGDSRGWK